MNEGSLYYYTVIDSPEGPIKIYTKDSFEGMRAAGRLAAETLDYITPFVEEGISTLELDRLCHEYIVTHKAIPAPLGYRGFPKSICTSINDIICHGIPNIKTILKKEDILNIDITVILDGWYGDTSRMFYIGKPTIKAKKLVEVTYECLMRGISAVKPGATTGDIGHAIQTFAESHNYSVVRDFCGHGLGRIFHDQPGIMHFGKPGKGVVLKPGMFFTIEPMINIGTYQAKFLDECPYHTGVIKDLEQRKKAGEISVSEALNEAVTYRKKHKEWVAYTKDRKLSAQFEHSLAVTEDGFEIFTKSPKGWDCPPYANRTFEF